MLAKPMALSLPLVMLLLDWYGGKKIDLKAIVSKWPFFIMVALIGWQTYSSYAIDSPKKDDYFILNFDMNDPVINIINIILNILRI